MSGFLATFFDPTTIATYAPAIGSGVLITLLLATEIICAGVLLGLGLALVRAFGLRPINFVLIAFVDVCRAIPPLVLIILIYFGFPNIGISLSGFVVVFIVLTAVLAAFAEEAFWAGLTALPRGQWEAGLATGLSFSVTLVFIALPQALRIALPPLMNRVLAIAKMTALASVVGVEEILGAANSAQSQSGSATPLAMAAIAYLIVFFPVAVAARLLESRFHWKT
ncbi:ABC transporter permease subunit [Methylobacterium sp. ARG-1]|uniref:amino acid ABC transporter permease n=1 Tax=Methylobacterium sp. ARG-1 TaxID=1692501 RepID=UPI0006824695|nr:ABC transporter permease subunit [Methylobacterium sp. ARG-1]KNY24482.1 polar amino acid ABC transporter permease [Methylobacterium sp. ARG-1]